MIIKGKEATNLRGGIMRKRGGKVIQYYFN